MELRKIAINVDELKPDMFICALDRPWIETPFRMQGFTVKNDNDIKILQQYCKFVYIDELTLPKGFRPKIQIDSKHISIKSLDRELPKRNPNRYQEFIDFEEEIEQAKAIQNKFSSTVTQLFTDITQGRALDIPHVKKAVTPMVNSIIRNPDAMIWLARLKSKNNYVYRHAMSVSIWAVALGRQLGLPVKDLKELAAGALLCDIGKINIPETLLNKPGKLSPEEFELIKEHVTEGVNILVSSKGVTTTIREIILLHHERHSGNGYPKGLSGCQIPIFARIVGIADCYDAIISHRPYATALSSSYAVRKLYEWRGVDFQHELVEEFIQSIGIYPAGSLVELSDGSVAIVVATGREQRLRPKIMKILDMQKKPFKPLKVIDMIKTTSDDDGNPLNIKTSLPSDAYGLDPEEYYI